MTSSRALQSQSNSPRLSTYCSLSKFFKLRLHLRSFFRRLPSVLLPSPWRYPRDCVCALPLERERSPSLSSRNLRTRAHLLCLQSGDTCCFFADIIKQSSPSPRISTCQLHLRKLLQPLSLLASKENFLFRRPKHANKLFSKMRASPRIYPYLTPMSRSARPPSSGSATPSPITFHPIRGLRSSRRRFSPTSAPFIQFRRPSLALILRRRTCTVSPKSSRSSCPTFRLLLLPPRLRPRPAASMFNARPTPRALLPELPRRLCRRRRLLFLLRPHLRRARSVNI